VIGAWVFDKPNGIRGFRYDSNFPDNFGDLGTGRYAPEPNSGQPKNPHHVGEIWCATLMEMTRNIGKTLGVQLVVDALRLTPANPSFLDGRDAILRELDNKHAAGQLNSPEYHSAWRGIWLAFAKFGMGPGARSNGAQLSGIVADFHAPRELLQTSGKLTFLGVIDLGTRWGPPSDFIDVEVVIKLDSHPHSSFGFQLRDDNNRPAREGMLALLQDAFNHNLTATINYDIELDKTNGVIIRVWLTK
jgi:hypothetical protein